MRLYFYGARTMFNIITILYGSVKAKNNFCTNRHFLFLLFAFLPDNGCRKTIFLAKQIYHANSFQPCPLSARRRAHPFSLCESQAPEGHTADKALKGTAYSVSCITCPAFRNRAPSCYVLHLFGIGSPLASLETDRENLFTLPGTAGGHFAKTKVHGQPREGCPCRGGRGLDDQFIRRPT